MTVLTALLLACCAAPLWAEEPQEVTSVFSDYLNVPSGGGIIRIPGLDFSSSMGFSYMSSDRWGDEGMGYYMGHFSLRLRPSITLRWDLGVGSMLAGSNIDSRPQLVLPNIDLTYRPSERLFLKIQYSQSPYAPRYHPWR